MLELQEAELKEKLLECENSMQKNPKPSTQLLDLNRMLEQVVKNKE